MKLRWFVFCMETENLEGPARVISVYALLGNTLAKFG